MWVKAQKIKSLEPYKRGGVGGDLNIYTREATCIKGHASLKDDPTKEISKKHLDKLISVQIVLDTFGGKYPKEVMIQFLEDEKMFKLRTEDLQIKHWKELEYVLYLLKPKNEVCKRWRKMLEGMISHHKKKIFHIKEDVQFVPCYITEDKKEKQMEKNNATFETFVGIKHLAFSPLSDIMDTTVHMREGL